MKIKYFLTFTGLWLFFPVTLVLLYAIRQLGLPGDVGTIIKGILLTVPIIGVGSTTISNYKRYRNGHRDFSLKDAIGRGRTEIRESKAARIAMYPPIPSKYLSKMPKDLVLGKYKGNYVHCPLGKDGIQVYCIGSPGSSKTVWLLGLLYTVFYRKRIYGSRIKDAGKRWNFVVVDIKGEIFRKLIKVKGKYQATGRERLHVFEPNHRLSYGWDVFYQLRGKNITPTVRLRALKDIADALVEEPKGNSNPYFSNNAKKILVGIMYYFSVRGEDFIEIIRRINETPMDDLLTKIVNAAKLDDDRITMGFLAGFVGKKDNESIQDVESTMKTSLECFIFPDIEYALLNNPHRTSPRVLNEGKISIDIAIEESFLDVYRPVFRLICVQVLRHCASEFTENDNRMTSFIFDEASAISRIPSVERTMATCRSRKTNVFLIFQNRNQFDDIYGKELSESILNLCELKLFLSYGGDKSTESYIQTMCGKYIDKKRSYSKEGFSIKNTNYSEEEKQIVDGQELMSLREKGEMIAFIYGKYYRFPKGKYYEDRYLAPIAKDIKDYNDRYAFTKERDDKNAKKQTKRTTSNQNSGKHSKNCRKTNPNSGKSNKACGKTNSKYKYKDRRQGRRTSDGICGSRRR